MYEGTKFRKVQKRVLRVFPNWYSWPRSLRLLAAVLPEIGTSELSIEDWCERRKLKYSRVKKQIDETPDFKAFLDLYRSTGKYPSHPNWRNSLTKAHLQILVAEGESFSQYLDLIDLQATGAHGAAARKLVDMMGYQDAVDPINEQPEIAIYSGDRVTGVVIDKEYKEEIDRAEYLDEQSNSLVDWADNAFAEKVLP